MNEDTLGQHIKLNYGIELDASKPIIQVDVFKPRGKWYSTKYSYISPEHQELIKSNKGFMLLELIECNDVSTHEYSPMSSEFSSNYTYNIDTYNIEGFCKYLLLARTTNDYTN